MKKFSDFLEGRCWPGYKPKPGKKAYSPGSCVKESAAAAIAAATAIAKKKSGNYDKEGFRKTPYKNPDSPNRKSNAERRAELKEDLRKWFSKTDPAGGWKRINSKGEAIGPCAREPGEPKPKCMSNEKRAQLSKKERASAVASKRRNDPNPERQGKPINVSNFGKGKISEDMKNLDEKNVPTSPEKWAQAKAQAKAKFNVYPSAYANGWASKKYKEMGGGWKSVSEAKDEQEYGYEGDMALNQLKTLVRCAEMIEEMLKPDTDLPEWVQSKITLATDYIQTAADYMYSEMKESVEQIDEITQADIDKSAEKEVAHAKKHGWKVEKQTYGRTYKHPKHGHIDMNRYGEWQHRPQSGIMRGKGNLIAHGNFEDLDKHISSLKEEVWKISEEQHKEILVHTEVEDGSHQDKSDTKDLHDRVKAAAKKHGATVTYQDRPSLRGSHTISARGPHEFHKEVKHIASDYEHLGAKHEIDESVKEIEELSNATLRGYADKARADIQKTLPKLHTDAKAAGRIDKRITGLAASTVAKVKNNIKKEEVEQIDEISDKLAGDYLKKVNDKLIKKVGMKPDLYNHLEPKRQKGATRALNRLMKPVKETKDVGDEQINDGTPDDLVKKGGKTMAIKPLRQETTVAAKTLAPATRVAEDAIIETTIAGTSGWKKIKDTVTDNSGAKHSPMSRARDLARKALQNVRKKQKKVEESVDLNESRRMEIVREAIKVAKKKKETTVPDDKYQSDPVLSSNITKT